MAGMTRPVLTAPLFDAHFGQQPDAAKPPVARPEKLWGAPAIARALGVSVDTVRNWASDPSVPIYRPKGYFARRSELEQWLKTKAPKT
jgi:hypothetical protein